MSIFDKQYLYDLKNQYQDQFQILEQQAEKHYVLMEYGKGGAVLHRGFYCPSPVFDLIVGNTNRGVLTKHRPKKFDFIFYKDELDRLIVVDWYSEFGFSEREFLIYNGESVIAPTYSVRGIPGEDALSRIVVCKYSSTGKITNYQLLDIGMDALREESYIYHPVSGLLNRSTLTQSFRGMVNSEAYQFYHDENGLVKAYQLVRRMSDGSEIMLKKYLIPQFKQRIV